MLQTIRTFSQFLQRCDSPVTLARRHGSPTDDLHLFARIPYNPGRADRNPLPVFVILFNFVVTLTNFTRSQFPRLGTPTMNSSPRTSPALSRRQALRSAAFGAAAICLPSTIRAAGYRSPTIARCLPPSDCETRRHHHRQIHPVCRFRRTRRCRFQRPRSQSTGPRKSSEETPGRLQRLPKNPRS